VVQRFARQGIMSQVVAVMSQSWTSQVYGPSADCSIETKCSENKKELVEVDSPEFPERKLLMLVTGNVERTEGVYTVD
jgi:hypothetical protein